MALSPANKTNNDPYLLIGDMKGRISIYNVNNEFKKNGTMFAYPNGKVRYIVPFSDNDFDGISAGLLTVGPHGELGFWRWNTPSQTSSS